MEKRPLQIIVTTLPNHCRDLCGHLFLRMPAKFTTMVNNKQENTRSII